MCYKYNVGTCKEPHNCQRLHLCAQWLFGSCTQRVCEYEHGILDDRNASRLDNLGLNGWRQERLMLLILGLENQIPMVCRNYNNQRCGNGSCCDYFHVCAKFVERRCYGTCHLNHRLHHSDNKQRIQDNNGFKWFDEFEQLRARLGLKLCRIPQFAGYDVLVKEKMGKNAIDYSNPQGRNRSDFAQSALVKLLHFL